MNIPPFPTFSLKENTSQTDRLNRGAKTGLPDTSPQQEKDRKAMQAATDFEALILKQMLSMMRKNIPESGLMDKSYGHDMYQAMQDEQLANNLAGAGGIGIARMMYQQITGQIKTSIGNK